MRLTATEHQEQSALIAWAALQAARFPELALLHAIPNGGDRHRIVAARLKAEGVKSGVPDLCLPVPRGGYHGLYIEMKAEGGRPSRNQLRWIQALRQQGFMAEVCAGFDAAQAVIREYLKAGEARQAR